MTSEESESEGTWCWRRIRPRPPPARAPGRVGLCCPPRLAGWRGCSGRSERTGPRTRWQGRSGAARRTFQRSRLLCPVARFSGSEVAALVASSLSWCDRGTLGVTHQPFLTVTSVLRSSKGSRARSIWPPLCSKSTKQAPVNIRLGLNLATFGPSPPLDQMAGGRWTGGRMTAVGRAHSSGVSPGEGGTAGRGLSPLRRPLRKALLSIHLLLVRLQGLECPGPCPRN